MAKLMRAYLLLAALFTTGQTHSPQDTATCAINGVEAADELVNSVLFIWQAASRCGKHNHAACSVDVSYAINSITGMTNVILKAVHRCGGVLNSWKAECGMAAGDLTEALAGIAATSSGIHEHCGKDGIKTVPGLKEEFFIGSNHMTPKLAHCVVDIKSMTKAALKASLGFATVKTNCDESQGSCVGNVLYIITSMAELGEYIAGVVGHCSQPANTEAACASEVLGLLRNLGHLAAAGKELSEACQLDTTPRLYLESLNRGDKPKATDNNLNFALAALLPISAAVAFVAGRRMSKSQRTPSYDAEMLTEGEE